MTYNIHRAIGVDRRFRPKRVRDVLEHHRPDVLLLQEVDDGVPRSREMDLAKELAGLLDYPYLAVGHNVTLRKGRYGNATLSRYPILGDPEGGWHEERGERPRAEANVGWLLDGLRITDQHHAAVRQQRRVDWRQEVSGDTVSEGDLRRPVVVGLA